MAFPSKYIKLAASFLIGFFLSIFFFNGKSISLAHFQWRSLQAPCCVLELLSSVHAHLYETFALQKGIDKKERAEEEPHVTNASVAS